MVWRAILDWCTCVKLVQLKICLTVVFVLHDNVLPTSVINQSVRILLYVIWLYSPDSSSSSLLTSYIQHVQFNLLGLRNRYTYWCQMWQKVSVLPSRCPVVASRFSLTCLDSSLHSPHNKQNVIWTELQITCANKALWYYLLPRGQTPHCIEQIERLWSQPQRMYFHVCHET